MLTIVGERVELSRLAAPTPAALRRLLLAAGVFALGTVVALVAWRTGLLLAGVGAVLQAAWLLRHDIARATVRRPGLPRFAATCMLAGHVWLTGRRGALDRRGRTCSDPGWSTTRPCTRSSSAS